jgi:hypothetical protein
VKTKEGSPWKNNAKKKRKKKKWFRERYIVQNLPHETQENNSENGGFWIRSGNLMGVL